MTKYQHTPFSLEESDDQKHRVTQHRSSCESTINIASELDDEDRSYVAVKQENPTNAIHAAVNREQLMLFNEEKPDVTASTGARQANLLTAIVNQEELMLLEEEKPAIYQVKDTSQINSEAAFVNQTELMLLYEEKPRVSFESCNSEPAGFSSNVDMEGSRRFEQVVIKSEPMGIRPKLEQLIEDGISNGPKVKKEHEESTPSVLLTQDPPHHVDEGESRVIQDLDRTHGDVVPIDDASHGHSGHESIEDTAYYRFGFVSPISVIPPSTMPAWHCVREMLGNGRWRDVSSIPDPPTDIQNALRTFFGHLSDSQKTSDIPREIYDLRQGDSDVQKGMVEFRIRKEKIDGKTCYFIRNQTGENSEGTRMEIGFASAADVLEVIRRGLGHDLTSISRYLLEKGISFNTFILGPHLPLTAKYIPRHGGLGFRPYNFRPNALDYQAYVSSRDQLLRTRRGRAALLAGGLVARLAKDVIDTVFSGPSDSVFDEGICCWNGKSSSPGYWDDNLTEDELDKICGVYKVATGISDFQVRREQSLTAV